MVAQAPSSTTTRPDYVERVALVGCPWCCAARAPPEPRWFDDFVRASVERDVLELSRIRDRLHVMPIDRLWTPVTLQPVPESPPIS